jgi:hypothetical protein
MRVAELVGQPARDEGQDVEEKSEKGSEDDVASRPPWVLAKF